MRYFLVVLLFVVTFLKNPLASSCAPPTELLGSRELEVWLNLEANRLNLARVEDDKDLQHFVEPGYLLPIPSTVCIDKRLEEKWRFVMPQTAYFLGDLGTKFKLLTGKCLTVTSAVRTISRQKEIIVKEKNPNAAPAEGPRKSLHFTGATVDITKLPLKDPDELEWLRKELVKLEKAGVINATEECRQSVFHITVFPAYEDDPLK